MRADLTRTWRHGSRAAAGVTVALAVIGGAGVSVADRDPARVSASRVFWPQIQWGGIAWAQAEDASGHDAVNPLRAIDKTQLKGFLERPLFDPSRHVPPPVTAIPLPVRVDAAPAAPIEPPPSLHLIGIIQGKDDIAVVRRDSDPKSVMLSTGDRIGDWSVTVLPSLGLQLRKGDRVFTYALFGTTGAPTGAVVPAAARRLTTR